MKKVLLVLVVFALAVPALAQEVVGGDEETLRTFIERVFGQRYSYGGSEAEMRVTVGQLPDEMTVDVPLPEEARIIGGVVYTGGYEDGAQEIYVDLPLSVDEVRAFYEGDLPEDFRLPENVPPQRGGGFQQANVENLMLCYDGDTAVVNVMMRGLDDGNETAVHIRVDSPEQMPPVCAEDFDPMSYFGPELYSLLPQLTAPEGATQRIEGGGGGPDLAESGAFVTAEDMSGEALLTAYNTQLEEAGWEMVSMLADENGGYSTWRVSGEEGALYNGSLSVVPMPLDDGRYTARLSLREHTDN
jgi:hypothetical protein